MLTICTYVYTRLGFEVVGIVCGSCEQFQKSKPLAIIMEDHDRSFEPMDVDLSAHSNSIMDISNDDPSVEIKQEKDVDTVIVGTTFKASENNIKKIHINIQKNVKCNVLKIRLFTTVFVLLISIVAYFILNINCSEEIDLENLRSTLTKHLVGQSKAIDSIIETFKEGEKSKILFFYGGTGVGKTFAASLLMDTLGYSSNIYHYTLPSFVKSISTDLMMGLILCPNSLIIIDDCDSTDMNLSKELIELINKNENLGKNITIILIYNCDNIGDNFVKSCDEEFELKLLKSFSDMKVMKKLIKFKPLSEIHLKKCIEKELGNERINDQSYEKISKKFNVTADGCKGVHSKIKLLNIK